MGFYLLLIEFVPLILAKISPKFLLVVSDWRMDKKRAILDFSISSDGGKTKTTVLL